MDEKLKQKGLSFAQFLEGLSDAEREEGNRRNAEHTASEHEKFKSKFSAGICYLCDAPLDSFEKAETCAHWLLNPRGFKKDNFPAIYKKYGFLQLQSYLRWVANTESFGRNINDIPEEGTGKLIEETIKFKNIEWSFSCSESDYNGHTTTQHARHSHYHFQMKLNSYITIKYSDFHIPFKDWDIIHLEAKKEIPHKLKQRFAQGAGMNDLLQEEHLEHIINEALSGGEYDDAPFKLDTFIVADEGTTISGDQLCDIFAEAKAKKVTKASLIHKVPNASVLTIVSPGPGVVKQTPREGGRKKGGNSP